MTDWIGGVGHVKGDPQISGLDGSGGGGVPFTVMGNVEEGQFWGPVPLFQHPL